MSTDIDPRKFRDALSSFATGVTIVTARDASNEPIGMTASSFNSVSMDPPLVLWSVTKTALSSEAFRTAEHWAVHVLASDQTDLSNRFAKSGEDKFSDVSWAPNADGVPIIDGCVACFECRSWQAYDGGDHWILVGEVLSIMREPRESLVFCSGSYAVADPIRIQSPKPVDDVAEAGDAIEELLMYQLSRATRQMSQQFHAKVRESGLTVAEWRVLASLHGQATRDLEDLCARTFLDPVTLADVLYAMQEQDLCVFDTRNDKPSVSGTPKGHSRVTHLFALGEELESKAVNDGVDTIALKQALRTIVRNTRS